MFHLVQRQPGPAGGLATSAGSHGRMKPGGGFRRQSGIGARHVADFGIRAVLASFPPIQAILGS